MTERRRALDTTATPRRLIFGLLVGSVSATRAADGVAWTPPQDWFTYGVALVVLAASVLSLLMIRAALTVSVWSFSDALSEPTEVTATETDSGGVKRIKLDAEGKPMIVTEMRASSSRVIALMGTVVILLLFLGFGAVAIFSFASTGTLPKSMEQVVSFLLAGLTLFAPYTVNKFSKVFEGLMPGKK